MHTPTHPHAQVAIQMANLDYPKRVHVNLVLCESGTPRNLYTLARLLRAARIVDEINAAYPAVLIKAA